MPDPFVKRQAKEKQEAQKAITAESFRAKEAQSLTKSIGTAGKPLVEPRQKEDKVATTAFTPSVDMSSGGDDDKSKTVEIPTTVATPTTMYTEPVVKKERSFFDKIFSPISSLEPSDKIKEDLLNPEIDNPYADLEDKRLFINLLQDKSFKQQFNEAERLRAIKRRKTSENSIRNSYYDLFTKKFGISPRTSEILTNVVDFTPIVGDVAGFEDAVINYKSGRYGAAAFDAALATIGLAPVAGDAIRKSLNGFDIENLTSQIIDYRGKKSPFSDVANYGKGTSPLGSSVDKAIKEWDDFVDAEGLTPYLNKASIENPDLYIAQKLDIIEALPSFPTRLKLLTLSKLDDLWIRHGWNPGAKGKFFTEIDDSEAVLLDSSSFIKDFHTDRISNLGKLGEFRLENVLYHKDLFDIYPELKDMNISWKSLSPRTAGHYSPSKKEIVVNQDAWKKRRDAVEGSKEDIKKINDQLMDLIIHEVQHAIQDIEGVGGFSKYFIESTYGGPGSYEVTRRIKYEIESDQFKINNMLDPKNTVTDKENKIKNLQKKILANKFKLDNFLSRLSFTRKIKRTSSPKLDDLTDAEFVSGYYRQYNELEARLAEDRKKMQKRFLASPYRSLKSYDAGYSGFDILSQASKDKDGIIDVEKYDQFVSTIYDGIKSFIRKNKKFNADNPFRDIHGVEMTPESEANLINNFFYQFVYKKKQAQNVVIHKDLLNGGFAANFDSQLNQSVRDVYDGVDPAEYVRRLFEDYGEVADFSDLEKINDTLYDLFKKQILTANDEVVDRTLGIAQRGVDVVGKLDSPQEFFNFLEEMEDVSPSYTDTLFARGQPSQKYVGERLNVPESEQTPFDDTYTVYAKANRLDVDPIPSISSPTKNIDKEMISVFPKPASKFPEGQSPDAAGDYINPVTNESVSGKNVSSASIKLTPEGKADFKVSNDNVDTVGSEGKGKTLIRTNLFDKSKGWKWVDAPKQYENIPKIISVEKSGKHYYTVETDFSKGVNLTKYPEKPTQPKLRPTVKGELEFGNQIGTISVRGKQHPVFEKITTFNEGGLI